VANRSTTVEKAVSAITSVRSELARAAVMGGAADAISGPPVGSGRDGGGNGDPPPPPFDIDNYIIYPSSPTLSRPIPCWRHQLLRLRHAAGETSSQFSKGLFSAFRYTRYAGLDGVGPDFVT